MGGRRGGEERTRAIYEEKLGVSVGDVLAEIEGGDGGENDDGNPRHERGFEGIGELRRAIHGAEQRAIEETSTSKVCVIFIYRALIENAGTNK